MREAFLFMACIGFVGTFLSCNQIADEETTDTPFLWSSKDTVIVWSTDADQSTRKRLFVPEDSINIAEPILNGINELWPEAGIFLKGQKNDTLLVGLQNENWLTNEIGNEGAESFLSFAAMNLLELKGINHIYFDLTPGVHAGAETWEDRDFADWKTGK
ncbi:MAG: hypothetical protein ACK55K_00105 [Bacteroidota bacterium]|jgi:hypothetical protein